MVKKKYLNVFACVTARTSVPWTLLWTLPFPCTLDPYPSFLPCTLFRNLNPSFYRHSIDFIGSCPVSLFLGCAESSADLLFPAFLANSLVLHRFHFGPGLLSFTSFLFRLASVVWSFCRIYPSFFGIIDFRNRPAFLLSTPFGRVCVVISPLSVLTLWLQATLSVTYIIYHNYCFSTREVMRCSF